MKLPSIATCRGLLLSAAVVSTALGATSPAAGQRCDCCNCELGIAAPVGTYSHMWQCGQVRAAHPAVVVHRCDWIGESDRLSPFATSYLLVRMTKGGACASQVMIEPSGTPALDERRRMAIVDYFARHELPIPVEAIAVGYATRDRLRGDDVNRVLENFGYQRNRAQTSQFNPFVGFGVPLNTPFGANGGSTFPGVPGFFGR